MADIPAQIRAALERAHISVNELARRAEYPTARYVRKVLAAEVSPDDATLTRLARALGVELVRPAVRFYPDGRVAECHIEAECHAASDA